MKWRKYRLEMVAEPNVVDTYDCQLNTREKAAAFLKTIRLDKSDRERVVVMAIASEGSLIGFSEVAVGDLSSAVFNPREILKFAVLSNAAAIIIAHIIISDRGYTSVMDKEGEETC